MAAKIITFLLILLLNVLVGAGLMFFLMLALNGFSERDASYAFIIFIAGAVLVSFLMAAAGVFLVKFLTAKEWNPFLAAALSVLGFTGLGFILKIFILVAGIFAAEISRTSR